ncbi:ribonuclease H2, subunit B [Verticillium dahliae]|nr:ribonuclease H2, subunit B [Verticillium dahliae]
MARTRATKAVPSAKPDTSETSAPKTLYSLPEEAANPPSRYLVCPETGIYEFTKIAAPKTTPRSWLIETKPGNLEDGTPDAGGSQLQAQITNGADLFIATAFDPLFLLPALFGPATTKDDAKRLFLTSDDHFDAISDSSSHLCEVLRCPKTRSHFEARMAVICDSVDAGDEKMFRVSDKKFVDVMIGKAKAMGAALPPSMEERFVKKPLEAPLSLQKSNAAKVETKPAADDVSTPGDSTPRTESAESQASATTLETSASFASEASTAATSVNEEATEDAVLSTAKAPEDVVALQKLRVALDFICASYATPAITSQLTQLRIEAASSMSTSNYSRKRHLDEEEEEVRAEKRRKLEDEKKRKANQSRGSKTSKKSTQRA